MPTDGVTLICATPAVSNNQISMAKPKDFGWRFALDLACCLVVGIPILVFKLAITPYRRGYFCDDDTIRYNYKDSTIHTIVLYFVGTTIPAIAFFVIEGVRYKKGLLPMYPATTLCGRNFHPLLKAYYNAFFYFAFGAVCSQLLTDIGKFSIGRLRPHFLDVCQSSYHCPNFDDHIYITDYECQGDPEKIKDARLSFPSGHASFSAYCMVYLALYLQFRFRWRKSMLLRGFLQFLAIAISYYTGLSRVSDNKHHWTDVLTGFTIGTVVAFVNCFALSDLYPAKPANNTSRDSSTVIPLRSSEP
ncbi:hypothetical protein CHUAL_003921 [Chamberlinius hualienensis]